MLLLFFPSSLLLCDNFSNYKFLKIVVVLDVFLLLYLRTKYWGKQNLRKRGRNIHLLSKWKEIYWKVCQVSVPLYICGSFWIEKRGPLAKRRQPESLTGREWHAFIDQKINFSGQCMCCLTMAFVFPKLFSWIWRLVLVLSQAVCFMFYHTRISRMHCQATFEMQATFENKVSLGAVFYSVVIVNKIFKKCFF